MRRKYISRATAVSGIAVHLLGRLAEFEEVTRAHGELLRFGGMTLFLVGVLWMVMHFQSETSSEVGQLRETVEKLGQNVDTLRTDIRGYKHTAEMFTTAVKVLSGPTSLPSPSSGPSRPRDDAQHLGVEARVVPDGTKELLAEQERLRQENEALVQALEDAEPAKQAFERLERQLAEYEPVERARTLESKTNKLIERLRELASRQPPGTKPPPRPRFDGTLRSAYRLSQFPEWKTATPEQIVREFSQTLVPEVLVIRSEFEGLGLADEHLDAALREDQPTPGSVRRVAEGLEALVIRLRPMAWPNPGP